MHIIAKKVVSEYQKRKDKDVEVAEAYGLCDCLGRTCYKCFPCVCAPGDRPLPKSLWKRMWFEGSYANKRVKYVFGFLSGIVLTVFIFYSMMVQFRSALVPGVVFGVLIATALPLALAFSPKVRIITMLVLPSMATDKGQALVLAYVLVIVTNGPVENFNYNSQVLAVSALCAQEQLLKSSQELINYYQRPLETISKRAEEIVEQFNGYIERMEKRLDAMADNLDNIVDEFQRFKQWYAEVKRYCTRKYGTTKDLCLEKSNNADYEGAANKMRQKGFILKIVLNKIWDGFKEKVDNAVCSSKERANDVICNTDIDVDIDISLLEDTRKAFRDRLVEKKRKIDEFFAYEVEFNRTSELNELRSINYTSILNNIKSELYAKVQFIAHIIKLTQYTLILFSSLVLLTAMLYLHKFHTKIHYDNHFINQFVIDMDDKRMALHKDKESIFPLSIKEKLTYIKPLSRRLTKKEFFKTIINLLLMIPVLINLLLVSVCDIGLWYVLDLVSAAFQQDLENEVSGTFHTSVEGNGTLADSYRDMLSIVGSGSDRTVDTSARECVPYPHEPDWDIYYTMRNFIIYLVLMAMFQGYILRLRHLICCYCYPQRARERAAFLYNEILQLRGNLTSFLRRQVRRQAGLQGNVEKVSLCHRIGATFRWLRPLINALGYAQKYCVGCGEAGSIKDVENFVHCRNYGCSAVYCKTCYHDLNNLCTACMHPIDYEDFGDISEERDSSSDEDEEEIVQQKEQMNQKMDDKLATIQIQGDILADILRALRHREQGLPSSSDTSHTDIEPPLSPVKETSPGADTSNHPATSSDDDEGPRRWVDI